MHFAIFVPHDGKPVQGRDRRLRLADVGLAHLVDGAEFIEVTPGTGQDTPGSVPGYLFGWRRRDGSLNCSLSNSEWIPAELDDELPAGRYTVLVNKQHPPRPTDLEREDPIRGRLIKLDDGQEWWFPVAAFIDHHVRFVGGSYRFVPKRKYQEFCDLTERWRVIVQQMNVSYVTENAMEYLRCALMVNYRLVREVENHLDMWSGPMAASNESRIGSVVNALFAILERPPVNRAE